MKRFENKVVWSTGASSGIGEALAKAFAQEGARVILSARGADQSGAAVVRDEESEVYVGAFGKERLAILLKRFLPGVLEVLVRRAVPN